MRRKSLFIDSFCGSLERLKPEDRTIVSALRALDADPRVSTFERGHAWMESLLRDLQGKGLVIEDKSEAYPWHRFDITPAGRKVLEQT